jgi:hypothetical protein
MLGLAPGGELSGTRKEKGFVWKTAKDSFAMATLIAIGYPR